ncbi:MAG: cation:proton antiporter [Candidatus Competibacter sp.]|nr:cation:proton antiporter [Candidatus Competibacter sp.]
MLMGHPVFWLLLVAVTAPLLAEIPIGFRVPVAVFEVVLGIVIGPQGLGLVPFEGFIASMFAFGMAASLFMAGMELDFERIRGRPLSLALGGWILSVGLGLAAAGLLYALPVVHAPFMVAFALTTTALGTLLPVLRDSGQIGTPFGRLFLAAGTVGEVGPIVAISLALSREYGTWQELGLLLAFLAVVFLAAAIGLGVRPPRVLALLDRTMKSSTQLPVRVALLILAAFFVLSEDFGLENILGAFAAGMVVGLATRGEAGAPLREKIDAVCFGWFMPFFFVGMGVKFNLDALARSATTLLLVPVFAALFLLARGLPVLLYRHDLARGERLPFALFAAVPSLSLVVVITEIGLRTHVMNPEIAAALVGAGVLAVLLFPTLAGVLLPQRTPPVPGAPTE